MNRILCSTGAIGYYPVNPDAEHMLRLFPLLDADGYEVIIDRAVPIHAEEWSRQLREEAIPVGMVHIGKQTGECFSTDDVDMHTAGLNKLKDDLTIVRQFGARQAVLHLWGWPGNDTFFDRTVQSLHAGMKLANRAGVELLVETIPCVAQSLLTRMRQLTTIFPHLRFTLDSRLMALQENIETVMRADWLWDEQRVAHIHVSDCSRNEDGVPMQRPILQPGAGMIDFPAFYEQLRLRRYGGAITLEAPAVDPVTRVVDVAVLNESFGQIRASMSTDV